MKKSILLLVVALSLFSCQKENVTTELDNEVATRAGNNINFSTSYITWDDYNYCLDCCFCAVQFNNPLDKDITVSFTVYFHLKNTTLSDTHYIVFPKGSTSIAYDSLIYSQGLISHFIAKNPDYKYSSWSDYTISIVKHPYQYSGNFNIQGLNY